MAGGYEREVLQWAIMKTVMVVDPDETDRKIALALLSGHYDAIGCASVTEAITVARKRRPHAVVMDLAGSLTNGCYDPIGAAARIAPDATVVCSASQSTAIDYARSRGASGLIEKPYTADSLDAAVRLAASQMAAERTPARPYGPASRSQPLVGEGPAMTEVARRIALYARYDAPVLILGETGTGKELAANAIHRLSGRRHARLLAVDCASIPETLAESVLFGTTKGSFTGSVDQKGIFESTSGGTVFLDEVGELSLATQAKFLRVLESGYGMRVGSVEAIPYDVRILAATDASIYENSDRFRPELLNRLNTLELYMPPLRDHKEDIPALTELFLAGFGPGKHFDDDALDMMRRWDWPGNVRELRNVVQRAAVLSGSREAMLASDIELSDATCQAARHRQNIGRTAMTDR